MRSFCAAVVIASLCCAEPAGACERDLFLFQLPGETVEAAEARSRAIIVDESASLRKAREQYALERASRIYVARKVSTADELATSDRLTIVRPIHSIRGMLPTSDQTLRMDAGMSGMCDDVGDGDVAHLDDGAYLVVFEGLPIDVYRRRGIDSLNVRDIRTSAILKALRAFGTDLE